jgi:hypothetical protein
MTMTKRENDDRLRVIEQPNLIYPSISLFPALNESTAGDRHHYTYILISVVG